MFHFLNAVEERPDERKELTERRLPAKTLFVALHGIPFDEQNPVLRLFMSAQQAVAEAMFRAFQNRLGFLIRCFKILSILITNSVADDFCCHSESREESNIWWRHSSFNPFPLRIWRHTFFNPCLPGF